MFLSYIYSANNKSFKNVKYTVIVNKFAHL